MLDITAPPFAFPCFIDGKPITREPALEVRYPYTGERVGSVPMLGEEEVSRTIRLSAGAHPPLPRWERGRVLLRAADRIEADAERVARLITWESGLCLADTRHEVRRALDVLRFAAAEALRDDGQCFSFDVAQGGGDRRGATLREPLRVSTAITPFNHPLNQVAHKLAPAIAVGTPVVIKPSERTPLT